MKGEYLSEKKTIQEKINEAEDNPNGWLEPFEKWIENVTNTGEIALRGSFSQKKAHTKEVFGSNRFLESKKARGSGSKAWSLLATREHLSDMVPAEGVEPTHPFGYKILSLARLPIPPRRHIPSHSCLRQRSRTSGSAPLEHVRTAVQFQPLVFVPTIPSPF
jgi:hypothetical protein